MKTRTQLTSIQRMHLLVSNLPVDIFALRCSQSDLRAVMWQAYKQFAHPFDQATPQSKILKIYPTMSPYIALPQNSDEAIDAQESKLPGLQQPLCHFRKNLARSYHVMLHILVVLQSTLLFMAYTEQQELKLHMLPSELCKLGLTRAACS